ncbi:WD40 repeat domain-containing protein [Actinoplanes ianthinogenes]|uniref:WD40 repeat domain-containing protein n=1 Tax=Actinoplanes ianthinogenes TaxID=122358 RepID=UPI001E33059D|nr:hypothetical protein [Actinoplanes ianthinogenes]
MLGADVPRLTVGPMTHDEATAVLLHDLPGLPLPDLTALLAHTGRWPLLLSLTNATLRERTSPPSPSPSPSASRLSPSSPSSSPLPRLSPSSPLSPPSPPLSPSSSRSSSPGDSLRASGVPARPRASGRQPGDLRGVAHRLVDQLGADGTVVLDPAVPSERERALDRVVQAALDLLPEADQRRFLELAIFPEGTTIPDHTLDLLWSGTGGLSPSASSDLRTALTRLGLLQRRSGGTWLRDVLRAYVRNRLPDAELPQVHRRLVEMARPRSGGPWWTVPQADRYLWRHLAFHLREARWWDELFAVATDLRRLAIGIPMLGVAAVVADLDRLPDPRAVALRARLSRAAPLLRPIRPASAFADVLLSRLAGAPELAAEAAGFAGEQRGRAGLVARWPLPDVGPDSLSRVIGAGVGWLDCGAVAGDGGWFAAGGESGVMCLVEPGSGAILGRLAGAGGVKALVAVGDRLVSGGTDGSLRVWDVRSRALERTLWTAGAEVLAVAAYGERIAAVGGRGELAVFDQVSRVFGWWGGERLVGCAFLDVDRVLTVSTTGTMTEHHLRTGRSQPISDPDGSAVLAVAVDPDGSAVLPVAVDPDGSAVPRVAVDPNGSTVLPVAVDQDGSAVPRVAVDPDGSAVPRVAVDPDGSAVIAVAVDPAGEWVALSRTDGEIRVHGLRDGGESVVLRGHQGCASTLVAFGDRIISGGEDGTVRIWDRYGPEVAVVRAHAGWVTSCVLTPDRRTLITTGSDTTIRVWHLPRLIQETVAGPIDWVNTCALLPPCAPHPSDMPASSGGLGSSGLELVTGGRDGMVRLWRAADALASPIWSAGEPVTHCAVAPDGNWIAALCAGRTVLLRRPDPAAVSHPTGEWEMEEWPAAVGCAVAPDLVAWWDTAGGLEIRSVTGAGFFRRAHSHPVRAAAFLPRHRLIFTDESGTLTVWHYRSGRTRSIPAPSFPTPRTTSPHLTDTDHSDRDHLADAGQSDRDQLADAGQSDRDRVDVGRAHRDRVNSGRADHDRVESGRADRDRLDFGRADRDPIDGGIADRDGVDGRRADQDGVGGGRACRDGVGGGRADRDGVSGGRADRDGVAGGRGLTIQVVADRIVLVDAVGVAVFSVRGLRPIAAAGFGDGPVTDGAISADGRWLATTSEAGELRIWPLPQPTEDLEPVAAMRVDGALFACTWVPGNLDLYAVGQRGVYAFTFRPPRVPPQPSAPTRRSRGSR